jgi:opacity protein-like surface antigen
MSLSMPAMLALMLCGVPASASAQAQESGAPVRATETAETDSDEESDEGHHELNLSLGHVHVPSGVGGAGPTQWLTVAGWGVNYNYWLSSRFAVGVHTDLTIESLVVVVDGDDREDGTIRRSRPVAPALMLSWKPAKAWTISAGAGREFDPEGALNLLRVGTEFSHPLAKRWEGTAGAAVDIRPSAHGTLTISLGLSRRF